MMMWLQEADITCRFTFPVDMLRYDACYPATAGDAALIVELLRPAQVTSYVVHVHRLSETRTPGFTVARWESFGCTVGNEVTRKR